MSIKVNFFASVYQREEPRTDSEFGINDAVQQDGDEGFAYTTVENATKPWNAVVENSKCHEVLFLPLDHNIIIHPVPSAIYSLCDGMLIRKNEWIAFVELKVQNGNWIQHNIEQLESTIKLFCQNHDYSSFRHRVAYAANRKHPQFHYSHRVQMNEFYSKTKFRLLIQNNITVK